MDAGTSSQPEEQTLLYFEKQQAALCGVHALNTLLQGPYLNEIDLAQFAHELDELEAQLMAEGGVDGADFLRYAAEDSGNVAATGMFSVQVLARALQVWELSAVPLASPAPAAAAARAEPQAQAAFVCNLQEHWFTVRRVGGEWWNFNSLFAAPEPLSDFYLAAFLASLQEQGYTIFLIQGQLPALMRSAGGDDGCPGLWFTPAQARAEAQATQQLKKSGFLQAAARGALDMASAVGTRMSLRSGGGVKRGHDADGDADADLARALAASRAESRGDGGGSGGEPEAMEAADDEDADLAAAIAASLAGPAEPQAPPPPPSPQQLSGAAAEEVSIVGGEAPAGPALPELGEEAEAGEGVKEVGVRLPSGHRHSRRFGPNATVGHVAAFAAAHGADMARHRLATSFPRKVLADWAQALGEAGVGNKQVLSVEPL